MKFKTYILTIKYNIKEDKPEFIREEIITDDDDVVIIGVDDIEDLSIHDIDGITDIGIT